MRFAVFTHVIHQHQSGHYYAYSPYVREMNLWFKYVEEVEIVAPLQKRRKGGKELKCDQAEFYIHKNLTFTKIPCFNLLSLRQALSTFFKLPKIFFQMIGAMRRADHLHLRCPGNVGLLAALLQIFFPKKGKTVKYAGNWNPEAKQPWSYQLQKWILNNTFLSRNIQVLVYGDWPGQSENIVPFFTASFLRKDREIVKKDFTPPYKFIYTGNLVEGKGISEAIKLVATLRNKRLECRLDIYGDGPLEKTLKDLVRKLGQENSINFKGRVNLRELKSAYRDAHFSILLSRSEGWPKAIAEAMWYGCVPLAHPVSCVPWMLGEGSRGILAGSGMNKSSSSPVEEENLNIVNQVQTLIENPEKMERMSLAGQEWSQQYTLEEFESAIQHILKKENPNHLEPSFSFAKQTSDHNTPRTPNSQNTTDKNIPHTKDYEDLRVLQLVDTLNPGGAERMAVNLANSLKGKVEDSYLCCTREEGMLKKELNEGIGYMYLKKKHSLDLQNFWRLRTFVIRKKINLVHAHGSSWFWGVLLKFSGLKINLVWHDHYGESEQLDRRDTMFLKPLSRYFDGIISVNNDLKLWAKKELKVSLVSQINNFILPSETGGNQLSLKGEAGDFKIICVANLRPQKDHLNLLAALEKLQEEKISLHLFGANPDTAWSKKILEKIPTTPNVYYYGEVSDFSAILQQADLGLLSSRSEGLPLVLLEYGMAGLPVVCTEVGQCRDVTGNAALLVPPGNAEALAEAIKGYYNDAQKRTEDSHTLQKRINQTYSREAVLPLFLKFYTTLSRK